MSAQKQTCIPIKSLYAGINNFTIKARVTAKKEIRTFPSKKGGESKTFNIDLIDEEGVEIQATFFDDAVDAFYEKIETEKVYTFEGGYVQLSKNPKFTKGNDYILNFQKSARIQQQEDDVNIKMYQFNFKSIDEINNSNVGDFVDVFGIIYENSEVQMVNLKNGSQKEKRTFYIYDKGQKKIEVVTWGEQSKKEGFYAGQAVAIKHARVGEFREQKQLSTGQSSQIVFDNLEIPEIQDIKEWNDKNGGSLNIQPLNESAVNQSQSQKQMDVFTLNEIDTQAQSLQEHEKQFKVCRVNIQFAKQDGKVYYPACSDPNCSKKVVKQVDGNNYTCEKHGEQQAENIKYRFLTSVQIVDSTQSIWVNLYDNQAQLIFGRPASEVKQLVEDQENIEEYRNLISEFLNKEFVFTILSQQNVYNNQIKVRHSIAKIHQQDSTNIQEIQSLLRQISLYGDFGNQKSNLKLKPLQQ